MSKNYIIGLAALVIILVAIAINVRDKKADTMISDLNMPANTGSSTDPAVGADKKSMVATNGDMVFVHYTGKLTDGTVFDSSIPRGEPIPFVLGQGEVIPGWEKGIAGMKIGEKKKLTIHPEDAYGAEGVKDPRTGVYVIPKNATLVFDVELVDIKR